MANKQTFKKFEFTTGAFSKILDIIPNISS